jgi:hypothetical protein
MTPSFAEALKYVELALTSYGVECGRRLRSGLDKDEVALCYAAYIVATGVSTGDFWGWAAMMDYHVPPSETVLLEAYNGHEHKV